MPFRSMLSFTFLCLFSSYGMASGLVNNLYHTERVISAVFSQSELNDAMSSAMEEVLVRVSGDANVSEENQIKNQLSVARNYLANFHYEGSAETLTNVLGEVVKTKKLVMEFDRLRIKNLLSESNMPIWDEARPSVLVFLAVETSSRREVFSSVDSHELVDALSSAALVKGIPYELPLMDIEDELAISPSEVWGLFSDSIAMASKRYNNEYALAGRVYQDQQQWISEWLVVGPNDEVNRFEVSSEDSEGLMNQTVGKLAKVMSQHYSVLLSGEAKYQVDIAVTGISTLHEYEQALDLLNGLSVVKQANVTAVEGVNISYQLDSYSTKEKLIDILRLNQQNFRQLMNDGSEIQLQWVSDIESVPSN